MLHALQTSPYEGSRRVARITKGSLYTGPAVPNIGVLLMNHHTPALDRLESDVLARMATHRVARRSAGTLTAGLALAALALGTGLVTGRSQSQGATVRGSERIVLADDARYSPAELLASN